jgi:serine/threonine protein kinase
MGAVYRARHKDLGPVAIKTVRPGRPLTEDAVERLRVEAMAARSLAHPNAVTVYDLRLSDDGLLYVVLEYLDGTTLRAELKRKGRFSPADAIALLEPVASVLDVAHARGIVHRDLKPDNLMLVLDSTGRRTVKVLDFGIAKIREATQLSPIGSPVPETVGFIGTPGYMSPEQLGWVPNDGVDGIDGRSDVFSLGVVAYELVTGKRPFAGTSVDELLGTIDELAKVGLRAEDVPPNFCKAVASSLARDRRLRPQRASDLVVALKESLVTDRGEAATTMRQNERGAQTSPFPSKPARMRPNVVALALFAVVLAFGGWFVWRSMWGHAEPAPLPAPPPPDVQASSAPTGLPVFRYYLEVAPAVDGKTRMTGSAPLGREQRAKLHLIPLSTGYLQIRAKTRVLLRETKVEANSDVVFPPNDWLPSEETVYTIVFSREPDTLPRDDRASEPPSAKAPSREIERPSEMEVVDEAVNVVYDEKTGMVTVSGPSDGLVMFDVVVRR